MKYIKLYEDYMVPFEQYGNLTNLSNWDILVKDIEYICDILPIEYDVNMRNKRIILDSILTITVRYDSLYRRDIAINALSWISILNYRDLVKSILTYIIFTENQWFSILEKHPVSIFKRY